jgi:vacuolar protein sorting-associated protein 45
MKGVFLLRATEENKLHLIKLLKAPVFSEYYLYFSNIPFSMNPQTLIADLAIVDEKSVVKSIQEVYADFCALNKELFTLNMSSVISLSSPKEKWTAVENVLLSRIVEGLSSVLLATRKNPIIRYQRASDACARIAKSLTDKMTKDAELFEGSCSGSASTMLFIIDRREDPITPLLNQWTYEAMTHELIGIGLNRVNIKKVTSVKSTTEAPEVVLSVDTDPFYAENIYSGYGELAANLKILINNLQAKSQNQKNIDSIEDMQKVLDHYPEYKKESANVYKHVDLMTILSKTVESRKLLELSKIEQAITIGESKEDQFKIIKEIIKNKDIDRLDKLRLVLLFAIRYEGDAKVDTLKYDLTAESIPHTNLIDLLLQYAGKDKRRHGLFSEGSIFDRATRVFKEAFKNIPNVFTQHKSLMFSIIESAIKGTLKDLDYPATLENVPMEKAKDIIVFIVGGATYQESREVSLFKSQGFNVLLGGTNMLNSLGFLGDITYYGQITGQIFQMPGAVRSISHFGDMKFH